MVTSFLISMHHVHFFLREMHHVHVTLLMKLSIWLRRFFGPKISYEAINRDVLDNGLKKLSSSTIERRWPFQEDNLTLIMLATR